MNFTLALAQIDSVLGNLPANVVKHVEVADRARKQGAQLVVFPELSLTGYSIKDMNWELAIDPALHASRVQPLLEISKDISVIAGGAELDDNFRIYNAAFLFEDSHIRSVHRKAYPPTYGMFEELRYFSPGKSIRAVQSKLGTLGVLICEDLWHLSLPYLLAQEGAQLIVALVASPTRLSGSEKEPEIATINTENHKAYARLLSSYVAFCNRVGYEDGINFWGGSSVVGPDGGILASAKCFDEDLLVVRIDGNEVRRARQFSRHFLDDNPDLVARELNRIMREQK